MATAASPAPCSAQSADGSRNTRSAPADTAVEAASARAAGTPTLWAPRRGLHQPRLQQLEATEEPLDLTAAARHQRRGRLLVDGGDLGCRLRMEVRGGMGDHQEAARRHRVPQPGDDPGRVLVVPEKCRTATSSTATGWSKSSSRRTSAWPRMTSGSRRSASTAMVVVWLASSALACTCTTGSWST